MRLDESDLVPRSVINRVNRLQLDLSLCKKVRRGCNLLGKRKACECIAGMVVIRRSEGLVDQTSGFSALAGY